MDGKSRRLFIFFVFGRRPVRFFAQTDKVFDCDKTARQPENHINRNEATELKPGKGCAINTEPYRLANNYIRFGGRCVGKAFVEKINDGQNEARERHEGQDEKSPTGPDIWERLCDEVVQTAPANEDKEQC